MELIRQSLSVIGVLLLAFGAAWWLRRRGLALPSRRERHLEILERVALAPHHALLLVRIGNRSMVIGLSPSGCTVLERNTEVRCGG